MGLTPQRIAAKTKALKERMEYYAKAKEEKAEELLEKLQQDARIRR